MAVTGVATAAAEPLNPNRPALIGGAATRNAAGYSVAGPEGARFSVPGGPVVAAEPGAELRVLSIPQPLTLGASGTTQGYTVVLRAGGLSVSVPKGSSSAVVLAAPRRVSAIVQNGSARANTTKTRTAVACADGTTTVSSDGGGFRPLPPGRVQIVEAGKTSVRDAVVAPVRLHGPRIVIAPGGSAKLGKLSWDPVAGATEYRARLRRDSDGTRVLDQRTTKPELVVEAIPTGAYTLSVESIDDSGLGSAAPLDQAVRVVGVELPQGAYADARGTLFLGKGQEARFVGVEGLEMTYGRAGRFVRAANKARLHRDEPTVVLFRFPGSFETVSARLAPRALKAEVQISPRTATWPKDPIDIRYRVVDGDGSAAPSWLEPRARVLLGLTPLDVRFTRDGEWMRARVAPRSGGGPWVVRVEVEDQDGIPLGRDFVEVVRRGAAPGAHTVIVQRRTDRTAKR